LPRRRGPLTSPALLSPGERREKETENKGDRSSLTDLIDQAKARDHVVERDGFAVRVLQPLERKLVILEILQVLEYRALAPASS
jgi:hypothetical protein